MRNLVLLGVLASATLPGAGECPEGPVLALPVRVIGQNNRAIQDLQVRDFVLTENRLPLEICQFHHAREPVSVGIVFDASGSMSAARVPALMIAQAGINRLLDEAGPQDEYFIQGVSPGTATRPAFSRDVSRLRASLAVRAKGKTALIDAVFLALEAIQTARYRNRALIIFSDGKDNDSTHDTRQLAKALETSPVPIFLLMPMSRLNAEPQSDREREEQHDLFELADRSGGCSRAANTQKDMVATAAEIATAIHSPYVLYIPTKPGRTPGSLRVEVKGIDPRPKCLFRATWTQ
jgi:VWFA-related protein